MMITLAWLGIGCGRLSTLYSTMGGGKHALLRSLSQRDAPTHAYTRQPLSEPAADHLANHTSLVSLRTSNSPKGKERPAQGEAMEPICSVDRPRHVQPIGAWLDPRTCALKIFQDQLGALHQWPMTWLASPHLQLAPPSRL